MFLKWDTNKDGLISLAELNEHIIEVATSFRVKPPDVLAMMRVMDSDNDG